MGLLVDANIVGMSWDVSVTFYVTFFHSPILYKINKSFDMEIHTHTNTHDKINTD